MKLTENNFLGSINKSKLYINIEIFRNISLAG